MYSLLPSLPLGSKKRGCSEHVVILDTVIPLKTKNPENRHTCAQEAAMCCRHCCQHSLQTGCVASWSKGVCAQSWI